MKFTIICTKAFNGVIGDKEEQPWQIEEEMKFFRGRIANKPLIMSRKQFEFGYKPSPRNIVITRSLTWKREGCTIVHSVDEAIQILATNTDLQHLLEPEVMIIGGLSIFKLFLPIATDLCITTLLHSYPGDVFFPELDWSTWNLIHQSYHHGQNGICLFLVQRFNRDETSLVIL